MIDNTINYENNQKYLREKGEQALQRAKHLEQQHVLLGKKYVRLNNKTMVLK